MLTTIEIPEEVAQLDVYKRQHPKGAGGDSDSSGHVAQYVRAKVAEATECDAGMIACGVGQLELLIGQKLSKPMGNGIRCWLVAEVQFPIRPAS